MTNLKLILIAVILSVSATPAIAGDIFTKGDTVWTTTDTVLQVAMLVLLEVDREQTIYISKHSKGDIYGDAETYPVGTVPIPTYYERNQGIGQEASTAKITSYFIAYAAGHTLISYGLRKSGWTIMGTPVVTLWQAGYIVYEADVVLKNYKLGIKMQF